MTNREIVAEYNEDAAVFTEDWYREMPYMIMTSLLSFLWSTTR